MFKPIHLSSCFLDPNISLFLLPKNWEINIEMQQKQVSDLYLFVHVFTVVMNPPLNESAVHDLQHRLRNNTYNRLTWNFLLLRLHTSAGSTSC